jgi:hypothetical protein
MPNTFLTPTLVARQALATLYENTVVLPLVDRNYEEAFQGKQGSTVNVRKPTTFVAEDFSRSAGIHIQDVNEETVPVVLDHLADVSFAVTSEELSYSIQDFAQQLLNPACEAIAQKIDNDLLALRDEIPQEVGVAGTSVVGLSGVNRYDADDPRVLIDAGRVLNQRNVPPSERFAIVGPATAADWQGDDLLSRADARGDTDGLREASLGRRLFGFEPYQSQNITDDPEIGLAFHRTAISLVTRPLALPRGAGEASYQSYKGIGLRVVFGYSQEYKQDVVSVDCLYGVKVMDANRACVFTAGVS